MTYRDKQYNTMVLEVVDNIATVTLNRPKALNASNGEMSFERTEIFEGLKADPDVKVVILTGGEKVFSAGGDLDAFSRFDQIQAKNFSERVLYNQKLVADLPKPTIAMVAGLAYGGGMEQVLQCDIRIAEEGARFAMPEINVGIFPGGGGTQRLPRLIPLCKAKELIFTGEPINAQTALELGILNKIVPASELKNEVMSLAKKLAAKSANALKLAKMCINATQTCDLNTGLELESVAWSMIFGTEDQKKLMQLFLDKSKKKA